MRNFLKYNLVRFFNYAQRESSKLRYQQYRKQYNIDESFKFNGPSILLYGEGRITLGMNSYIGLNSTIQAGKNHEVIVGSYCAISHYVKIYTISYLVDQDFITPTRKEKSGSVIIGDGVWIGANVLINPGVRIGSNSVIGANSVVSKNVEPNSIVSGVPAIFIRNKKLDA